MAPRVAVVVCLRPLMAVPRAVVVVCHLPVAFHAVVAVYHHPVVSHAVVAVYYHPVSVVVAFRHRPCHQKSSGTP